MAHSVRHHRNEPNVTKGLVTVGYVMERVKRLAIKSKETCHNALGVCQTSQRNWVAIKVHYGYLRKYLLGWHESRLGFVTPYDGEVSLGPLGKTSS